MYGLWSFINTGVYFLASLQIFWDILPIVLFETTHHTGQLPSTPPSRKGNGECNMAVGGGEVASYKGGGECHILVKGVVKVWFYTGGDECLGWWMSEVVNVWGGEYLGWWTSDFTQGVVTVWGGERLGWWTSDFTLGVVNVWGGECLGGERLPIS